MSSPTRDVVLIFGASSGIGRATALEFAKRGASLVLAARSGETLRTVHGECTALGADVFIVAVDGAEEEQLVALIDKAIDRFGRIDVLVGTAGVFAYGTVANTPTAIVEKLVDTNLFSHVRLIRAVLPHMLNRARGHIIVIGSVYSRMTTPYVSAYVASKHALFGFTRALRQEIAGSGVRVSLVMPTTVDTPIYQHAANYTLREVEPLKPLIAPERVAKAIVRLTEHPRAEKIVGVAQAATIPLQRIARPLFDRAARAVMRRFAVHGGRVEPTPGTLFTADPTSNRVSGGWRGDSR